MSKSQARRSIVRASLVAILAGWAGLAVQALQGPPPAPKPTAPPLVYSAIVDALIHPVSAEFMVEAMDRADREGASLLVFTLRTPGGLLDSTRTIVSRMFASKTPIAVYVGPAGNRAASAGFLLTIAADVAAMAPGTHIGAAHPVQGGGEKLDETMAKKMASDVAADARTWASRRGRNVQLADEAVRESRSFTEEEAAAAQPPLIDYVARDVFDLLRQVDGRTIKRFDGSTVVVRTANARVVPLEMSWRQRVLSAIAHPNVAYLLLSLGMLGLTIELWNPGAILPGVAGGICLLLAFYTFQVLPVNYAGVLLLLFGIVLLALEVKVTSHGILGAGGVASLLFGSLMMMDAGTPEMRVSLSIIVPVVAAISTILVMLVRLALASQRTRPFSGTGGMIGERGRVIAPIGPGRQGQVRTHGEIWSARADEPLEVGDEVVVSAVDGLVLKVSKAPDDRGSAPFPSER